MIVARLQLITPEALVPPDPSCDHADPVGAALAGALDAGAPWVQVRTKAGTDRARWSVVTDVVARCRAQGAACVVNDRADLALAAGAQGVHLGLDDLPVAVVRDLAPPGFLIGATARGPDQARRAVADGADYLGVGPVRASGTKTGLPAPIGLDGLAAVAAAVDVPVVAIGGLTAADAAAVLASGAHGLAVVGAVFGPPGDPASPASAAAAVRDLLDALAAGPSGVTGVRVPVASGSGGLRRGAEQQEGAT